MREQDHIRKTQTLSGRLALFLLILLTSAQSYVNASCIENLEDRHHVSFSSIETPYHTDHGCLFDQQRDQNPSAVWTANLDRGRQHLKRVQYFAAASLFYALSSAYAPTPIKFLQAIPFDSSWHLFKFTTSLRTTVIIV